MNHIYFYIYLFIVLSFFISDWSMSFTINRIWLTLYGRIEVPARASERRPKLGPESITFSAQDSAYNLPFGSRRTVLLFSPFYKQLYQVPIDSLHPSLSKWGLRSGSRAQDAAG